MASALLWEKWVWIIDSMPCLQSMLMPRIAACFILQLVIASISCICCWLSKHQISFRKLSSGWRCNRYVWLRIFEGYAHGQCRATGKFDQFIAWCNKYVLQASSLVRSTENQLAWNCNDHVIFFRMLLVYSPLSTSSDFFALIPFRSHGIRISSETF